MLSQSGHPARLQTVLAEGALVVRRLVVEEAVSAPFRVELDLLSEDAAIDGAALLRTPATVSLDLEGGEVRHLHGLVARFAQVGREDGLVAYRAELVPALQLLALARDSRVHQQATTPEILEEVLQAGGMTDFELKLTATYDRREYCVQYGERTLDFVHRLMEDEGIFYYFRHEAGRHVLVLADANASLPACPAGGEVRYAGHGDVSGPSLLRTLVREQAVHASAVALRDYNFATPSSRLESVLGDAASGELFEYPGGFAARPGGDRRARIRLEAEEARRATARGTGNARLLAAGHRVRVTDHFDPAANGDYLVLEVRHVGEQAGFRPGEPPVLVLENAFTLAPFATPFRPALRTPRPRVAGAQTAAVVGPAGEEIYVDKYGRVKVQFHWDRVGKRDADSSCWIRVATAWAGKGWGMVAHPRIGQEVIVDFLEGDPDQPIIVGSVYNAEHMPPYALPANMTQSGVKTRSTKGGSADHCNELRFEDKKGSEQVFFHAERNFDREVERDDTLWVGHDQTEKIKNHRTVTIEEGNDALTLEKGNRTVILSKGDHNLAVVEGHYNCTVKMQHYTTVTDGGRMVLVEKGDDLHQVDKGHRKVVVATGDDTTEVGKGNHELAVSKGNSATEVAVGNLSLKASKGKVTIEAMQELVLKVGTSTVTLKPTGIEMKIGKSVVKLDPSGSTVGGPMVKLDALAMAEVKGLTTKVGATTMLQLQGVLTKIN